MKTFNDLINACLPDINEVFPWDINEKVNSDSPPIIVDVREPGEYNAMHIAGSINAPRGILESACDYNYEETIPELTQARDKEVILVCRSGNRSVLAAYTLQIMGYQDVKSLKTGLRGWNDYELALVDANDNIVDVEDADTYFAPNVGPEQLEPS